MRYSIGLVILIAASMACSRSDDRVAATSPTSPTSAAAETTITYVGGVSGPMDVLFPARNESFLFRNDLENKYATSLGRAAQGTFVDREGEVVWMQEYIRYRVNGCDQATSLARVMTQIDGGAAGGICTAPPEGVISFPPRNDIFDARRALETKYQQMGRGLSSTTVDPEGSSIWITEYLRYRTNACLHADAQSKVFSQIDGGPVPPTCITACSYVLMPAGLNSGWTSSTQGFEVRPASANSIQCQWTATSTVPWLTFASTLSPGVGYTPFTYNIAQNNGGGRTGYIDFTWQGGAARYQVNQDEIPFASSFTMVDPFRSSSPTTECHFRSAATPCNFTATTNLPGGGAYTYNWTATYFYGIQKTVVQNNTSNVFTITDGCGGTGSTSGGPGADLSVTVTITDSVGNSITLRSGEGNQPALAVRLFTC
ncbi:MAG: hypothetical protein K2Y23_24045 [Cyanobacteria bacterium]|nr:hypothetical protein [Cyanobacteriota bacterium]